MPIIVAPNTVNGAWYASTAVEEKKAVVSGKGMLHFLYVVNTNASARYVFVYDGTDTSGTLLMPPLVMGATNGICSFDCRFGMPFSTGLYLATSTTIATYTASAASESWFGVGYNGR